LVWVSEEILAEHRQPAGDAGLPEVLRPALKELSVRKHRQTGGAMPRIARRDVGRMEVLAEHALAWTGFLDLGNHRRSAALDFRP
jgi:hypothetical protein